MTNNKNIFVKLASIVFLIFGSNISCGWDAAGKGYNAGLPDSYRDSWDANSTHAKITEHSIYMSDTIAAKVGAYSKIVSDKQDIINFSTAPDVDEVNDSNGKGMMFCRHFYNPKTGKGLSSNLSPCSSNALVEFRSFIKSAFNQYKYSIKTGKKNFVNRRYDLSPRDHRIESVPIAAYDLGKALHFLQDIGQPFHSRGIAALDPTIHPPLPLPRPVDPLLPLKKRGEEARNKFIPNPFISWKNEPIPLKSGLFLLDHAEYEELVRKRQDEFLTAKFRDAVPVLSGDFINDVEKIVVDLSYFSHYRYDNLQNDSVCIRTTREVFQKTIESGAKVFYLLSSYIDLELKKESTVNIINSVLLDTAQNTEKE